MEYDDETRSAVVIEAARLFNQFGYDVASLDIVERELRFRAPSDPLTDDLLRDREALAMTAFDYAVEQTNTRLYAGVNDETDAVDQLLAIVQAFRALVESPSSEGGCPVFDAALHSASALPFLEDMARSAVSEWRRRVRHIVRRGIQVGDVHPAADAEEVASIIVGTMEGAIFLYRIYNDASHLDRSVAYLAHYLDETVRFRD